MSLQGFADWLIDQVEIVLMIAFILLLLVTAYKRAWIVMAGVIVGFSFIGIFVVNPEILLSLSEWMNDKIRLGEE